MNGSRRSIPFHVTLLTLMVLIVLPLAAALLWLGWRAVDQLEESSVRHRMAALDSAVEGFLTSGLRVVVAVGSTLAETQAFAPGSTVADEERLRQFSVIVGRYPAMAAIYVGYEDGRFLYVGRTDTLSISQRLEFDAPDAPSLLMREVAAGEGMRRESWWFELADGSHTPVQTRMVDFDPRARPWYVDAMRAKGAVLTEPYSFAQTKVVGVSAGMPLRQGGVIGFDFTLDTLSRLIGDYRFTANSIIMVASDTGTVFMESEACRIDGGTCLPGEDEVRAACAPPSPGLSAAASASSATSPWAAATIDCWCTRCRRHSAAATWSPQPCRSSSCRSIRGPCWNGPPLPRQSPWHWPSSACCSPRSGCRARSRASPPRPSASAISTSPIARGSRAASPRSCGCPIRSSACAKGWRCSAATCRRTSCSRSCARPRPRASAASAARSR